MLSLIYKYLPVIFGCHCREERTLSYNGKKFPICARCTGELVGIIFGILANIYVKFSMYTYLILLIPMIMDGTIQLKTKYESTNRKRFITGFLFGYGLISIFIVTSLLAYNSGYKYGKRIL